MVEKVKEMEVRKAMKIGAKKAWAKEKGRNNFLLMER